MRRLPFLLLLLMAALFFATLHRPEDWAGWVRAFAEAGMVGALADWFAVVALFRHPLGLPIPHTAIIPARKNDIGDNLARFVADHFLHPDVVRGRLQSAHLAGSAALWLKSPAGRRRVERFGAAAVRWSMSLADEARVRQFLGRLGSRGLATVEIAPMLGRTIEWLIKGGRHREMLTQSLRFAMLAVHDQREAIRQNVQRESPWWMPGFIDDRVMVKMLDRIETLLLEMSLDPQHRLRADFDAWLAGFAEALMHAPEWRRWGEGLKQDIAANEGLQDYLFLLWSDLAGRIHADLEAPESRLSAEFGRLAVSLADDLERDVDVQRELDRWLLELAVELVEKNRYAIAGLISETVRSWDPVETSGRIEAAIGRDLQFIRINGTLVGGLVGLAIHAAKAL